MRKFLSSGLYEPPFFIKHRIEFNKIASNIDDISYDFILVSNYYQDLIEDEQDEDRIREIIEESFFEALKYLPLYFEPLIFNPDIALECGLIPLTTPNIRINNNSLYRSCKDFINVLILPSGTFLKIWTERLYPKLDAYQALTDNSIDKESYLFKDLEHFEAVVGKSLTQKVVNAIS